MCRRPQEVSNAAAFQIDSGRRPTVRSVPGPVNRIASNVRSFSPVQPVGPADEPVHVVVPGRDRVGLVEPYGLDERAPEPFDVGLAEDRLRPALVRVGDDRPVDEPLVQLAEVLLRERYHPRLADAGAVEVAQQLRLGVAGDRDQRAVAVAERPRPLEQPRWRPRERLLVGVRDHFAPDMLVGVEDVHVPGACRVRGACDRACQRRVLHGAPDVEHLPRREVGAHAHGQLRVALESLVDHVSDPTPFCHRAVGTRP